MSSTELCLESGWLAEVVRECTCGTDGMPGHMPGCGLYPIVELSDLPGWDDLRADLLQEFRTALADLRQMPEDVKGAVGSERRESVERVIAYVLSGDFDAALNAGVAERMLYGTTPSKRASIEGDLS